MLSFVCNFLANILDKQPGNVFSSNPRNKVNAKAKKNINKTDHSHTYLALHPLGPHNFTCPLTICLPFLPVYHVTNCSSAPGYWQEAGTRQDFDLATLLHSPLSTCQDYTCLEDNSKHILKSKISEILDICISKIGAMQVFAILL